MNNPDLLVEISADAEPIPVSTSVIAEEIQKLTLVAQQAGQELDEITFATKFNREGRLILLPQAISLKFRRPGMVAPPATATTAVAPASPPIATDIYANLRSALGQSDWKQANQETWNLLCLGLKKAPGSKISRDEITKLPCEMLQKIDRLWQDHSQGKFGFSIQQQLYRR